jgi:hypothetical protein
MGFSEKRFIIQAVSSSAETLYTLPANTTAIIKSIHMCNNSSSACKISMWIRPDGVATGDENVIFSDFDIPANDFLHWNGYIIMDTENDIIRAEAETNDAITVCISGGIVT